MRFTVILILLLLIQRSFSLQAQCEKLIWSDEFNGSEVDQTKWSFETGNGQGGWGTGQMDYCTTRPENVRIEDGALIQEIRKEPYQGFQYTSARMISFQKASFQYGRIEARIKGLYSQGLGFAFWMLGSNYQTVTWPKCGEVDIFELTGKTPGFNIGTAHFQESWGHSQSQGQYTLPSGRFADDYHVIGIEWSPVYIKWYIDGTVYHTFDISKKINGYDPFNHPFFLILSSGVGGSYSGEPDATTVFPMRTYIDWVRVYQGTYSFEISGGKNVPQNSTTTYTLNPSDEAITSYNWHVPQGAEIISGQGSRTITVKWGAIGGSVSVDVISSCNQNTYSTLVEVADPATVSIAQGKPAIASSQESNTLTPTYAVDGDATTRWSSAHSDPQWIYVDLQNLYSIEKINLKWETASAKEFKIQVSDDKINWTDITTEISSAGGNQTYSYSNVRARYVRIYGSRRNTEWGYSLYEIEVFGSLVNAISNSQVVKDIRMYPNPVTNRLYIPNTDAEIQTIRLYNPAGVCLLTQHKNTDYSIDLSDLSSGIYLIQLNRKGSTITEKIVKQ